jgi:hypothetical protein
MLSNKANIHQIFGLNGFDRCAKRDWNVISKCSNGLWRTLFEKLLNEKAGESLVL